MSTNIGKKILNAIDGAVAAAWRTPVSYGADKKPRAAFNRHAASGMSPAAPAAGMPQSSAAAASVSQTQYTPNGPQNFVVESPPVPFQNPPRPQPAKKPQVDILTAWPIAAQHVPDFKISAAELTTLRDLQSHWKKMWQDAFFNHTRHRATLHFRQVDHEQWEKFYNSTSDVSEFNFKSESDIFEEFSRKSQFAKHHLVKIAREAVAISQPIRARFVPCLKKYLAGLEENDRAEAEALGCEFVPSPRLQMLRSLAARLRDEPVAGYFGDPQSLVPFVKL